jgi:hypothetical protein
MICLRVYGKLMGQGRFSNVSRKQAVLSGFLILLIECVFHILRMKAKYNFQFTTAFLPDQFTGENKKGS